MEQSLDLATAVPSCFANKGHRKSVVADETGFGPNTHRHATMGEVCDEVEKNCDEAKSDKTTIIGLSQ